MMIRRTIVMMKTITIVVVLTVLRSIKLRKRKICQRLLMLMTKRKASVY